MNVASLFLEIQVLAFGIAAIASLVLMLLLHS
jgi:hypothetical protein